MVEDVVNILRLAIENGAVRGPINVVAPHPVRNVEFTAALASAVHRPALFAAPAFALRLAMGEMADALLLASQRVVPDQLQRLNFRFAFPYLATALGELVS
jgi:NAD dependent epimerase/dehydratase family enzyme